MGFIHQAASLGHKRIEDFEKRARRFLDRAVPELGAALIPDSHVG